MSDKDLNPDDFNADADLQTLVSLLWQAGAEAIAINGNRLGVQTSIRTAGSTILIGPVMPVDWQTAAGLGVGAQPSGLGGDGAQGKIREVDYGGIERTIMQFHREIDEDFRVVATGGLSRVFADALTSKMSAAAAKALTYNRYSSTPPRSRRAWGFNLDA